MGFTPQEALKQAADKLKNIAVAKRLVKSLCKPLYPDLNTVLENSSEKEMLSRAIADEFGRLQANLQIDEQEILKTYESQLAELNQNWETKRLGLIPGDTLLDEVCKLYGVRFKKDIDSARIAALMTEAEIEPEIALVIREIGRP